MLEILEGPKELFYKVEHRYKLTKGMICNIYHSDFFNLNFLFIEVFNSAAC